MKPKLLIIHNRLVVGGPALDTIPLAYHLQNNFDIHILYGRKEKDETEPVYLLEKYEGLQLINIPSLQRSPQLVKDVKAYKFISDYIKLIAPDIVHTHGAKVGFFGRIAAKRRGVPLIIHTFHGHLFHSYFNRLFSSLLISLEKRLSKITNIIIAISESQKQDLKRILNVRDDKKIQLVPLGVDYINDQLSEHYRKAFRRTYQLDNDTICVGILGRMVSIKNPIFFLEVAASILKKYPAEKIKFFIVGDGSETVAMKQYLKHHQILFSENSGEHAIIFTSWVQNIQNILDGLDIVVLTSLNEGTPLSLIEAQLCSKPVVAVNVGGVKDTMQDGKTGFLIQKHDVALFADAILKLAKNSELRETMGKNAKEFASATFSKENEIERMQKIYLSYNSV